MVVRFIRTDAPPRRGRRGGDAMISEVFPCGLRTDKTNQSNAPATKRMVRLLVY
jgi:hypothetical protein